MLKQLNNIEEFNEYLEGREVEASFEVIKTLKILLIK